MFAEISSPLVLGSRSASRAALLEAAGLTFETDPADIDEDAIRKVITRDRNTGASDVADVLARAKAETVAERHPGALVIGADQVLAAGDELFEKPATMKEARRTLLTLRGRTHQLHTAVALAREGNVIWGYVDSSDLTMRALTPEYIGKYLAAAGESVLQSVGAYQLEGLGVNLFDEIRGDYFAILGLPLLPLLAELRREGGQRP
ncbi:septum formation protein Maf [bacterium BMS3Bbin10]|nr:septum formation protein Maf [bacterium BMS3Bbin10]HDL17134.1 septum formation protein Maf [Hyphomicrobiales bacterium]